tara:strand:- start:1121 stop:1330 length:210 start_codon:yes stop_codon:yes gene_type:complete
MGYKMSFKNQYKKKFNKTFNNFNSIFSSDEYLDLKLELNELSMLDGGYDEISIDEQEQINKELGVKFNA